MNLNLDGSLCMVCCDMECRHCVLKLEPMGHQGLQIDEATRYESNRFGVLEKYHQRRWMDEISFLPGLHNDIGS